MGSLWGAGTRLEGKIGKFYDNSILAKGTEMQQLIDCAKRLGVYVSIGYSERDEVTATLYNSNMMISPREWQDTIRHIAIEGHCFFINCDMYFTKADYPKT